MQKITFSPQKYIKALYWIAVFSTFFLSYIRIGPFPMANYIAVLIAVILVIIALYGDLSYLSKNKLVIFSVIISILIIITMALHDSSFIEIVYRILKSIIVGLVLSVSAYLVVCTYGVRSAIKPILFCALITSLVAILQSTNIDIFWQMREVLGYGGDRAVRAQIESRERIPGMAFYAITLSYQLLVALSLGVFYLVYSRHDMYGNLEPRNVSVEVYIMWIILAVSIGLLLSGARSSYPALLMLFFVSGRYKISKVLIFFIIILFALYNQGIYDRIVNPDLGGRYLANITAINVLIDKPFGLGGVAYVDAVITANLDKYSLLYPHNHLLTAAASFGVVPVIIFLIYNIVLIFRTLKLRLYSKYAILAALFVYNLNTLFHNTGMILGEQAGWYLFGIIEGVLTIYAVNKKSLYSGSCGQSCRTPLTVR